MRDPLAALAGRAYRWRWAVLAFWVVLVLSVAPFLAPGAAEQLKGGGLILSGTESANADEILGREFGLSSQSDIVAVFRSSSMMVDDAAYREQVMTAVSRLRAVGGIKMVTTWYDSGLDSLVSPDRHATIAVIVPGGDESSAEKAIPILHRALNVVTIEHYLVGNPAAAVDGQASAENDLRRSELVTLPLVLVLLLVIFRTAVAALIPLVLGLFNVGLSVSLLDLLGMHTDISVFALNVGSLIGLGLSIDYSLIILTRYREELAIGHDPERALAITMANAGRSIAYSGAIVVVAMFAITVVLAPIMVLRSMSLAVLLVTILAVLLAMSLLPALMALLGHRLEWRRVIPDPKRPRQGQVGIWYRFSHQVMKRPWVWLAACLLVVLSLAAPVAAIKFGAPTPAMGTEAANGVNVMSQEFAAGRLAPTYVLVVSPHQDGVWRPDFLQGIRALSRAISADPRVADVSSLSTALGNLPDAQFTALTRDKLGPAQPAAAAFVNLNARDDTTLITVVSKYSDSDSRTTALVETVRQSIIPSASDLKADTTYVGGQTAVIYDFKNNLFARFPAIALTAAVIIFVILMMFFRSIVLPVKAVLMNILSIGATFGFLSLVFQRGLGDALLGFTSSGYVTVISPAILYVILFALSTDYEVFMLSRVKEYFSNFNDNQEAVAAGLQHTAGIITAAGLILLVTFGSFVVSSTVVLKEIGLGLALGVLIDATVVRVVMVPATMRLLGSRNWWMPVWLARVVPVISDRAARELADYAEIAAAPAGAHPMLRPSPAPTGPPLSGPASLLVSGSWDGVSKIPLSMDQPLRFGRLESNEVHLPSLAVSRWHARIDYSDGQYRLTDLGSANGVYVNGARIAARPESTVLRPADHVVVGGYPAAAFTLQAR